MNSIKLDRKRFFLFADRLDKLDHPFDNEFLIDEYVSSSPNKLNILERLNLFEKTFPVIIEKILRAYFDQNYDEILVHLEEMKQNYSSLGAIYHKELCSIAIEKLQVRNYTNMGELLEEICHSQDDIAGYIRNFLDKKNNN